MIASDERRTDTMGIEQSPQRPVLDVALAASALAALRRTNYLPLCRVEVTAAGGRVVLVGRVPRHHLKQVAQTIVKGVPGVVEVRNEIEVVSSR
ncbi:MAG: BON domain-containing protein [Planctomycetaceae bacterium]|nr:BON domain-containing protein [Planctomycetaceae bacterium]